MADCIQCKCLVYKGWGLYTDLCSCIHARVSLFSLHSMHSVHSLRQRTKLGLLTKLVPSVRYSVHCLHMPCIRSQLTAHASIPLIRYHLPASISQALKSARAALAYTACAQPGTFCLLGIFCLALFAYLAIYQCVNSVLP